MDIWRNFIGKPWIVEGTLVLGICLPALCLLGMPGREFGLDWPGHLWMTAYFGEFFRHHGAFPDVLNTDWISGMPYPVFYGFLLYPVAGLLSVPLGADAAMRLLLGSVMVLQCLQVRRLLGAVGAGLRLAWLGAALFAWSTYFLTNLYNRSALPEFIAVALLSASLCCFLRVILGGEKESSPRALKFESFLYYVLAAGVHPLTAVFGALLIAFIMVVSVPFQPRSLWPGTLRWGAWGVLATSLVLSPWLYATGQFHRDLAIHQDTMTHAVHFSESIDRWDVRLFPWPLDVRMEGEESLDPSATPYLDAQVNVPLLLLALVLSAGLFSGRGVFRRKGAGPVSAVWAGSWLVFIGALMASLVPGLFRLLPAFFDSLQFAYRLVAYQNLALLGIIAGALGLLRGGDRSSSCLCHRPVFQGLLLVFGLVGLIIKLTHAGAVMHPTGPDGQAWRQDPDRLVHLPHEFYGWPAYGVPDSQPRECQPGQEVFFPVGRGGEFGRVAPVTLTLDRPREMLLQVQPFPWSRLLINGQPVKAAEACHMRQGYAVKLPPGSHEIAWHWQPDGLWSSLGLLSFVTLVVWVLWSVRLRLRPEPGLS